MSMRIYTPPDFKAALKRYGFEPTGENRTGFSLWRNKQGEVFTVPEQKYYPDYILDNILLHLSEDGIKSAPDASHQKTYKVTD